MNYDKSFIEICRKLGENIQKCREEKGMTIKELAEKTGIRKEYIKKIEDGKAYGVLLDRHIFKIAEGLNIKLSKLLTF